MSEKKRILVAPLNWGLGHATRCIPIIKALLANNFDPVIASDGAALELLKREFPNLLCLELPPYNITYSKKGSRFKYKILKDSPKILKNIKVERQATANIVANHNIAGIISDNRFGVLHKGIPNVFMTHQLQVLSGSTTWLSTKMHQKIIKKFDECWVPDSKDEPNLSGKLGHTDAMDLKLKYVGPISRFNRQDIRIVYDIMVLISGPEPQRTLLEEKLMSELRHFTGKVLFVKGIVEGDIKKDTRNHITYYNYLTSDLLEKAINESKLVISRSGYTTIMDLAKLGKQAFFIPTPGQFEQVYLAETLHKNRIVPSCSQESFSLNILEKLKDFEGLEAIDYNVDYKNLFGLFHTE